MLRFLSASPGSAPAAGPAPAAGSSPAAGHPGQGRSLSSGLAAVRLGVVAVALATSPFIGSHPAGGGRGFAVVAAVVVAAVAWVVWAFSDRRPRIFTGAMVVLAAAGGAMAGLNEFSPAIAVGCVVTSTVGVRLPSRQSLAITVETVAAFLIAGLSAGAAVGTLVGYPSAFVGLWAFGLTRHSFLLRAEEAERALEQERRARSAEREAAALGERARLAREIHDVLAHSLAAISVNLQAAEGVLAGVTDVSAEGGAGVSPEVAAQVAKALECVERAGALSREGLVEARRAVMALRGTASPLPEQLAALTAQHAAAGDATVDLTVTGAPRAVPPDASLTAYRAVQEALTNARKHAPGQPVTVDLEFFGEQIAVRVANPVPDVAAAPPGGAGASPGGGGVTGGGHGLTGLRERATLSGGTLTAGLSDGQWRVCLRIPA